MECKNKETCPTPNAPFSLLLSAQAAANVLLKGLNAKPKKAAKGKSKAKKDEEGTTETPPGDGAA